jgi:hypothetical protein
VGQGRHLWRVAVGQGRRVWSAAAGQGDGQRALPFAEGANTNGKFFP